ncbi:flagellar motor switch protein FliM [Pseudoalteromonas marina]|uniref:Flagellar motor switch protein FliM n=1 Tax=Pseudoalteromonas marina TaxID=267375 RepID=A0ABT9FC16_9GAMM|nr:FliM/FliN family flagellar motor switch protein [Pseudoalteromonas marina]MDP2564331.1 FliM/FliN family flagellar motor switch protein [Pseudoalteromonas marina]
MTDILNQDEIDFLLNGGSDSSGGDDANNPKDGEPQEFDYSSFQKIIRGKIPALDVINDTFARNYQRSLSMLLSTTVNVTPSDVRSMRMSEYQQDLMQPTGLNVVKISPFNSGSMLIVVEAGLSFGVLNMYFGGEPTYHYKIEGRDFHPIEKDFMKDHLASIFTDYKEAWSPIWDIDLSLVFAATNPKYDTSTSPNELVYVSKIDISFEGGSGAIHFCIPFKILAPFIDELEERLKSFQGGVGSSWKPVLAGELLDTLVDVDMQVAKAKMKVSDLKALQVGGVIPINQFSQAVVTANGHPLFIGDYCVSPKNLKSLKIKGALKHPSRR